MRSMRGEEMRRRHLAAVLAHVLGQRIVLVVELDAPRLLLHLPPARLGPRAGELQPRQLLGNWIYLNFALFCFI